MSEEVKEASLSVPKAMFWTFWTNGTVMVERRPDVWNMLIDLRRTNGTCDDNDIRLRFA